MDSLNEIGPFCDEYIDEGAIDQREEDWFSVVRNRRLLQHGQMHAIMTPMTKKAATTAIIMPTNAPVDNAFFPSEGWLAGDAESRVDVASTPAPMVFVDMYEAVNVAVVIDTLADGFSFWSELGGIPPVNRSASLLSLSLAARSSLSGQPLLLQGSMAQHPKKGGLVSGHVYQETAKLSLIQAWGGILYRASKVAGSRCSSGQRPFLSPQGFKVQQPMNRVGLSLQM